MTTANEGDATATVPRKGWAWPGLSKKAHYFYDARSLCNRWAFSGPVDDEGADTKGPDDCAVCRKRYDKTYGIKS